MEPREIAARLLRRIAEALERSSPADFEDLLTGKARFVVKAGPASPSEGSEQESAPRKRGQRNSKRLAGLEVRLRRSQSREEGLRVLASAQLSKNELEELARSMDLPVLREDDAERLRQKIVETSIGSRLNSEAIRGG
jgi:hypothetical protein